jgi:hypothetical protein
MTTMKSIVGHIHLDKHTFWYILYIKVTTHCVLLLIPFNSDCVHIYAN